MLKEVLTTTIETCISTTFSTQEVSFDKFWLNSRFNTTRLSFDSYPLVKNAFDQIRREGGFITFLECSHGSEYEGSLVVFKDPWYRSYKRDDVACFGLVTASDSRVLGYLLEAAAQEIEKHNLTVLRGPINPPRSLFGYGVQVCGYEMPVVAGSASNPPIYKKIFAELDELGYFEGKDRYYNLSQDFKKTREYMSTFNLDRSFRLENPDFNNLGELPTLMAGMMNRTLGYRPDYMATSATKLRATTEMYKLVPGSERLIGLFFDGKVLAGAIIMQPDWFQVLSGKPATTIISDVYMLDPAYQGRRLFLNLSEYTEKVLAERGTQYYEHASIWEHMGAVTASVKNGYAKPIKEYWIFEKRI